MPDDDYPYGRMFNTYLLVAHERHMREQTAIKNPQVVKRKTLREAFSDLTEERRKLMELVKSED